MNINFLRHICNAHLKKATSLESQFEVENFTHPLVSFMGLSYAFLHFHNPQPSSEGKICDIKRSRMAYSQ